MKKTKSFEWNDQADEAFRDLKHMLHRTSPVRTSRQGVAVALHSRDLTGGQHGAGGRATREGQDLGRPTTGLLPERSALRLQAELPALPGDVLRRVPHRQEAEAVLSRIRRHHH